MFFRPLGVKIGQYAALAAQGICFKHLKNMEKKLLKHFNKIKAEMEALGVYKSQDDLIIENAALLLSLIDDARKNLKEQVQVYPNGTRQISPELSNLRGLLTDFQKCASQLGLTPSSRKRIGIENQKKQVESKLMTMRKKIG